MTTETDPSPLAANLQAAMRAFAAVAESGARPVALLVMPDGGHARPTLVVMGDPARVGAALLKCCDALMGLAATPEAEIKRLEATP
jgi:hypothetical protein